MFGLRVSKLEEEEIEWMNESRDVLVGVVVVVVVVVVEEEEGWGM